MTNADDLINTAHPCPFQAQMLIESLRSWDYYWVRAYPAHAFGTAQWDPKRGPHPTCLPYGHTLISQGAEFVFRNGAPLFSISPAGDTGSQQYAEADAFLQQAITANRLPEMWVSLAETLGNQGAIAVKWSVDADNEECPVRIAFLSVPQECRVWFDPMDWRRPLMARIQFPYRDYSDNKWYYYREEWTDDFHVTYKPLLAGTETVTSALGLPNYQTSLGDIGLNDSDRWEIDTQDRNPFGVIPVTVISNRLVKGNPFGVGDIWHATKIIDRIALTMHGEDKANQLHSDPIQVAINADVDNDEPIRSNEIISIKNATGADNAPDADFKLVEPSGTARPHVRAYADKMESLLFDTVGLSRVNPETISNKGNMSSLVLRLLYEKTISTSDRKRQMWGETGLCLFFKNLLVGVKRLGGIKDVAGVPDDVKVGCQWPDYFAPTDTDKQAITERTILQVDKSLWTQELAIDRIARVENLAPSETVAMKKALTEQVAAKQAQADAIAAAGDPELKADSAEFGETEHIPPAERQL